MSESREQYRIEGIQLVRFNGKIVKVFKAFRYDEKSKAYIFCGAQQAPAKTANKNLKDYIQHNL